MYRKVFKSHGEHFIDSQCASWMKEAFPLLDEMFGEHSKICTTVLNCISEDFHLKKLDAKYNYVPHESVHSVISFRGLQTDWYTYYRTTAITYDGNVIYEIGYRFVEDTDAVRFKLMLP